MNYDVWLEKILKKNNIKFSIAGFESDERIVIHKPHGSISFCHKSQKVKDVFTISYEQDILNGNLDEFEVVYQNLTALNSINAMVPPAGDSNRLDYNWARDIRESVQKAAETLDEDDELIICGTSYWHVDRLEIDRILTAINSKIANVKVVNPNSPEVFNAVITTLFSNVKFFKDSKPLVQ